MYQIKVIYLDGENAGRTYVYTKGGWIAPEGKQFKDDCYITLAAAKSVATKYNNRNNRRIESDSRVCHKQYEAIEVETIE